MFWVTGGRPCLLVLAELTLRLSESALLPKAMVLTMLSRTAGQSLRLQAMKRLSGRAFDSEHFYSIGPAEYG